MGLELTVESDCPYWVLYDEEPQAICVEPWTAPPNSFNLPSPEVVTPAAPLVATMTWRWHELAQMGRAWPLSMCSDNVTPSGLRERQGHLRHG